MSRLIFRSTPRIDCFAASLANHPRNPKVCFPVHIGSSLQPTKKYQEPLYASLGTPIPSWYCNSHWNSTWIVRFLFYALLRFFLWEPSHSHVDFCRPLWKIIPKKWWNVNLIDQIKHDFGFVMIFTDLDNKSSFFWNFVLHGFCYNWHNTDPVNNPKKDVIRPRHQNWVMSQYNKYCDGRRTRFI